jgi:hypothetical protein
VEPIEEGCVLYCIWTLSSTDCKSSHIPETQTRLAFWNFFCAFLSLLRLLHILLVSLLCGLMHEGSRDSVTGMVIRQRAGYRGNRCLIPGRGKNFYCPNKDTGHDQSTPSLLFDGYQAAVSPPPVHGAMIPLFHTPLWYAQWHVYLSEWYMMGR